MTTPSDSLDDIFGSSPPDTHTTPTPPLPAARTTLEPSELPSLRRQHVTAGYRDGISASKAEHVQRGFDAGFPIGAQLGMRAGTILGILEGLVRGYESRARSAVVRKPGVKAGSTASASNEELEEARRVKREQVLALYKQAVKDLGVQAVFAGLEEGKDEEKPEGQLLKKGDKALSPWEGKVSVAAWEENAMDTLEAKSENGADGDSDEREGEVVKGSAGQS